MQTDLPPATSLATTAPALGPDKRVPAAPAAKAPASESEVGPRIWGVIDAIRSDRIAGWAIDRSDSGAALDIDILREGLRIATVRAERPRKDLEKGGVGTGRYGFVAELDPALEPGFEFTIEAVARASDGATGALRRAGPAATPVSPERRVTERLFEAITRLSHASASEPAPDAEHLRQMIDRIEVTQARLEATLSAVEAPAPKSDRGLRIIVFVTAAVAAASLGLGILSFLSS